MSVGYKRNLTESFITRGDLGAIMTGGLVLSASTDIAQVTEADIDKELAKTRDYLSKLTVYPFISIQHRILSDLSPKLIKLNRPKERVGFLFISDHLNF